MAQENIPEHRTADMPDDILIKHVKGQLRFVRKGYYLGNYSPAIYRASRSHLLEELKVLRKQLPGFTLKQVMFEHQKRADEFAKEIAPLRDDWRKNRG